jgi:hypothetical protein
MASCYGYYKFYVFNLTNIIKKKDNARKSLMKGNEKYINITIQELIKNV